MLSCELRARLEYEYLGGEAVGGLWGLKGAKASQAP